MSVGVVIKCTLTLARLSADGSEEQKYRSHVDLQMRTLQLQGQNDTKKPEGTWYFKYLQVPPTDPGVTTSTDPFTTYYLLSRAIAMPISLLLRELVSQACG
jgi:hypothetical protein